MVSILNKDDVVANSSNEHYDDQVVVIKSEYFKPDYRSAKYQLFHAKGGFGCDPSKIGTAVFGYFLADGDEARVERYDILGIATPEAIEEWKKLYGEFAERKGSC